MQKHRISTEIGKDQFVKVELTQDFELLEILSLKFTQKEAYASYCSDYGVVAGRIIVNNGLGVPNAKISIFVPLNDVDSTDPVISALYPYTSVTDRNEENYRYNLLPSRKQHGGHEPTGTFPDQWDIFTREEILEVYEKYYKYTVKTNDSGDFMIWGVPLGSQTIHVDVDLSDIGCFSLRPYDFIRLGYGEDNFKNSYSFKSSEDIDSLPQIVSFDKSIEVFPFWGMDDVCEIGITRVDFDLSSTGIKIEPKAYLIGGVYTDSGKNSINKNCQVRRKMGRKCDLITKTGKIESIRFSHLKDDKNLPILERLDSNEDIPEDGGFVFPVPMNTEYVFTNEFGENEISNNPKKGVPTAACYRFRFTLDDRGNERVRKTGSYLVPNIREYQTNDEEKEKSYSFSTEWYDVSGNTMYPTEAMSTDSEKGIFYNIDGQYHPRDYFYRMTYNKVYTVSSFHSMYYPNENFRNDRYIGLKELVPTEEENCSEIVTPPVNYGVRNRTFSLLISEVVLFIEQLINMVTLIFFNTVAVAFHVLADAVNFWPIRRLSKLIRKIAYRFQNATQKDLNLINYPECEECSTNEYGRGAIDAGEQYCQVGTLKIKGSSVEKSSDRVLTVSGWTFEYDTEYSACANARVPINVTDFLNNQDRYLLTSDGVAIFLNNDTNDKFSNSTTYSDPSGNFPDGEKIYDVIIRDVEVKSNTLTIGLTESGCEIYDTPYNENLIYRYYIGENWDEIKPEDYKIGDDVVGTKLSDRKDFPLADKYEGDIYERHTHDGYTQFSNGVFTIVPGSLSTKRLIEILVEYRRRKRVGKLFCGGIVNYSFVENWLSGSLYFILFKAKNKKYCKDVIRYSELQKIYYYRSSAFSNSQFGIKSWRKGTKPTRFLGRPTTLVDLGPRDEFIKEICVDPTLDPNCSISRSIGSTSHKNFGEILGLAINYRMDVADNDYDIKNFFKNTGVSLINQEIFTGDLLQLISINNETGIEEFDIQSSRYMGYSYEHLDPDNPQTKNVFFTNGVYGPLPITFYLDEDGKKVRACLNQEGRLTESSQKVPFFLWDKKGMGFGSSTGNQFWDYSSAQVQPLQGMFYGYQYENDDKYLLLPMTYNFSGLTIPITSEDGIVEVDFDYICVGSCHNTFNNEYPGFMVLEVTSGTVDEPIAGVLYTRIGAYGVWDIKNWVNTDTFIIRRTQDYYTGTKQILSTPFLFHFGLKEGNTGLDKFIKYFGDKGDFTTEE